jgi:hypothetical protein
MSLVETRELQETMFEAKSGHGGVYAVAHVLGELCRELAALAFSGRTDAIVGAQGSGQGREAGGRPHSAEGRVPTRPIQIPDIAISCSAAPPDPLTPAGPFFRAHAPHGPAASIRSVRLASRPVKRPRHGENSSAGGGAG